jgi:hypothetical protein
MKAYTAFQLLIALFLPLLLVLSFGQKAPPSCGTNDSLAAAYLAKYSKILPGRGWVRKKSSNTGSHWMLITRPIYYTMVIKTGLPKKHTVLSRRLLPFSSAM